MFLAFAAARRGQRGSAQTHRILSCGLMGTPSRARWRLGSGAAEADADADADEALAAAAGSGRRLSPTRAPVELDMAARKRIRRATTKGAELAVQQQIKGRAAKMIDSAGLERRRSSGRAPASRVARARALRGLSFSRARLDDQIR